MNLLQKHDRAQPVSKALMSYVKRAACAMPVILCLGASPASAQMIGGGIVSDMTQACDPNNSSITTNWSTPRVAYRPGERSGGNSEITLVFTDGTINFARQADFERSNVFYRSTGIELFQYNGYEFYQPRPRIRVLRRTILGPSGAGIETATNVFLRMRVNNYWGVAGCSATIIATVGAPAPDAAIAAFSDSMGSDDAPGTTQGARPPAN